jgi:hypothetical protein
VAFIPLEHACSRHRAFLEELARLAESEFPYTDSEDAIKQITRVASAELHGLERLVQQQDGGQQNDPAVIRPICANALDSLFDYLPCLGYILRSTNVRNAFEVFRPLLRLARSLLEPDVPAGSRQTRLILASEWDYFPLKYSEPPALHHFVFIGLPSPESSNPLLLPLTGHEMGHAVWETFQLKDHFELMATNSLALEVRDRLVEFKRVFQRPNVSENDIANDPDVIGDWIGALNWTLGQAKESFCDFLGLCIFGPSYLSAFAYLISPNDDRGRSLFYPTMSARVSNLKTAAAAYRIPVPDGYEALFEDDPQPAFPAAADAFRSSIADAAAQGMVDDLVQKAESVVEDSRICLPSSEQAEMIAERLSLLVPAENCECLADILNAAWRLYEQPALWREFFGDDRAKINQTLKELVLKNIEVFEIEQIQGAAEP